MPTRLEFGAVQMMTVVLHLKSDVLAEYICQYLLEIRSDYFSHVNDALLGDLQEATAKRVSGIRTTVGVNLDPSEVERGLDNLREDAGWLVEMVVHCFHDAANMFRRRITETDPILDCSELMRISWSGDLQKLWCRAAIDAGVVDRITVP